MIKMRGLALLCLLGFILTASWPKGGTVLLANTGTDTSRTDGSPTKPEAVKVVETDKQILGHWFLNSSDDFPPNPTDGAVIEVNQK